MIEIVASNEVGKCWRVLIVRWRLVGCELYSDQKVGHKILVVCGDCWSREPRVTRGRAGRAGVGSQADPRLLKKKSCEETNPAGRS